MYFSETRGFTRRLQIVVLILAGMLLSTQVPGQIRLRM
jgi:peptidyl-prolyl cis-trans isomerase A (cyclophilin A)